MGDQKKIISVPADLGSFLLPGLILGAFYGITEAALSLDAMKTARFEALVPSVAYRLLLGGAFYAQVFILTVVGAMMLKALLTKVSGRIVGQSPVGWSIAASVVTAAALPIWVRLNQLLPSIKSTASIIGNLLFVALCVLILLAGAWLLGRLLKVVLFVSARSLFAFAILESVFIVLIFTASNLPPPVSSKVNPPKGPNIILITIDTLRADHLSGYGYQGIKTPNLDRLANQGVLFERAIAPSSWTMPSLASYLTGVYQEVHEMYQYNRSLDTGFETVAETLGKNGYATMAVVTNGYLDRAYKMDQGFDIYLYSGDARAYHPFTGLFLFDFLNTIRNERYNAQNVTDRAIELLKQNRATPFFLWIHYIDPHTPYGGWYIHRFPDYDKGYTGPLGNEFTDIPGIESGALVLSEDDKRHILALYDAEIMYVDHHIGRLLDAIKEQGLAGDTAVIATSDHGEEFWDHGGLIHGRTLYTESVHVPLIMALPGSDLAGKRVSELVGTIDLAPTICRLAELAPLSIYDGKSLLDVNMKPKTGASIYVSLEKPLLRGEQYGSHGVYDPDSTYLKWILPDKGEELFNSKDDPLQKKNQATKNGGELQRLRQWTQTKTNALAVQKAKILLENADRKFTLSKETEESLKGLGYLN